jgi:hypothetical protein
VRPDSARQWWPRLFRVFPVCDSEPGRFSASSLVTTVPVTPCRIACFPFGTVTFITAASPAHCLLTEVEQPVRQGSGPGRGACAPSRTRQRNHLAAQTKKLCENLPEPLKTREKPGFWQDLQAGWREVPWNRRAQAWALRTQIGKPWSMARRRPTFPLASSNHLDNNTAAGNRRPGPKEEFPAEGAFHARPS